MSISIAYGNGAFRDGYGYSRIRKGGIFANGKVYDSREIAGRYFVDTISGYSQGSGIKVRESNRIFESSVRYPVMDYQTW